VKKTAKRGGGGKTFSHGREKRREKELSELPEGERLQPSFLIEGEKEKREGPCIVSMGRRS